MNRIQIVFALVAVTNLLTLAVCNGTMLPTDTPSPPTNTSPTPTPLPAPTVCGDSPYDLKLNVCWNSRVEAPGSIVITIEMTDPDANYSDWVLGDVSGEIAGDRLNRGEFTTVELEVDWSKCPLLSSKRLFYVYGEGDDGSTFAQVVEAHLYAPSIASPTPTLSCGYARFVVTTASDLSIEYPNSSFSVWVANEGILQCGDLDWWIVEPSLQTGMLSCSPVNGVLEGSPGYEQPSNTEEIWCTVDWSGITPQQTRDYFLVLFSYPRVNGTDSAHLIRVRAARP
jgi:hypothetical protein